MQYVTDQVQAPDLALLCSYEHSILAEPPKSSSAHKRLSLSQATPADGDELPNNPLFGCSHRNTGMSTPRQLTSSLVTSLSHPYERCAVGWEMEETFTCTFQWSCTEHMIVSSINLEILQNKAFTLKNTSSEGKTELVFKLVVRKLSKSWATLFFETIFKSRLLNKKFVK